jgi:magnesium chelatase family protein
MQITSFTLSGLIGTDAAPVSIRCTVDAAKPAAFHVEGVSPAQSKEIAVRVRSAISASDLCAWPQGRVTIVVDAKGSKLLAPALDLPIALAIAGVDASGLLVAGELGLDGSVRPVRGALQAALLAKTLGLRGVLVPVKNVREAQEALDGVDVAVYAISRLADLDRALSAKAESMKQSVRSGQALDFADVRGQAEAIAKVEQSVATRAGLLLSGSPGVGKTMIGRRIPGLLPQMSRDEQIEVTRVYSALGLSDGLVTERSFRAPHHTISAAALTGGGTSPRPGEVQLATRGVLFLDEVVEFTRAAIESLAYALDRMPAASRPLVVASANPCPCGWHGSTVRACTCTAATVARYTERVAWVAGKLGLSIRAAVQPMSVDDLRGPVSESSASIAGRIAASVLEGA